MATTTFRPDGTISAGNWSVADSSIPGVLNDSDDATIVYNTTGDQTMSLTLDNPASDIDTVTSITPVIRCRRGGKGSASFTITIEGSSATYINAEAFSTSAASLETLTGNTTSVSFGNTEANSLRMILTGTSGTQGFFADVSFTIVYTASSSDAIIRVESGKLQLSTGKIIVLTT